MRHLKRGTLSKITTCNDLQKHGRHPKSLQDSLGRRHCVPRCVPRCRRIRGYVHRVSGLESNPSGGLILRKLLILQNSKMGKNCKNAEVRYTAGTRPDLEIRPHGPARPLWRGPKILTLCLEGTQYKTLSAASGVAYEEARHLSRP